MDPTVLPLDGIEESIKTIGVLGIIALMAARWFYEHRERKKEENGGGLKSLIREALKSQSEMMSELDEHRVREESILQKIADAEDQQTRMIEKFLDKEESRWDKVADAIDRLRDTVRNLGDRRP